MNVRIQEVLDRIKATPKPVDTSAKPKVAASPQSVVVSAVTPKMAQRLITENMYPGQRPLSSRHVQFLAEQMKLGDFRLGRINLVIFDGKEYIVNGQHTLSAIVQSGIAQTCTVERLTVNKYEDIASIYATIDIQKTRTDADAFSAMGLAQELEITRTDLNSYSAGVKVLLGGFRSASKIGRNELAHYLRYWQPQAREFISLLGKSQNRNRYVFSRSPVWAVALVTLSHAKNTALEFWGQVIEDDGIKKDDPRKKLREELLITTLGGNTLSLGAKKVGAADICRMCALAWNAYVEGRTLSHLKYKHDSELRIVKTPYRMGKSKSTDKPEQK